MRKFEKLFIWENLYYTWILNKFEKLVVKYFGEVHGDWLELIDTEKSTATRKEINYLIKRVNKALSIARISPVINWSPPPNVGGRSYNVDVIENIFNLQRFTLGERQVKDFIEKAIGQYKSDIFSCALRSVNPFFWLLMLIRYLASLPFVLLESFGVNRQKAEKSLIGNIFKGIFTFVTYVLTTTFLIIQILEKIGVLANIKDIFK